MPKTSEHCDISKEENDISILSKEIYRIKNIKKYRKQKSTYDLGLTVLGPLPKFTHFATENSKK